MSTPANLRSLLPWLIPVAALAAYGAYLTDYGRALTADGLAWRKPATASANTGVVPDIAFNADASPYAAVTDRNLFVPWRKPAPPPEPPPPAAEPPKPQIRRGIYALTGTMQVGDQVFATVKENATNRAKQVKVGDTLQEYSVKSVDTDRVILAFAGQEEELVLARFTQSGRATPPPALPQVAAVQQVPPAAAPLAQGVAPSPVSPGGVPGGIPPRVAPPPGAGGFPIPPNTAASAAPVPPQSNPVPPTPSAQSAAPEVIDVGELLRRRREARKQ
jgi:hypothetical protein